MHYENVPFKFCGSIAVLLDLWTPEGEPPEKGWPTVLYFHGGGWSFGDKNGWKVARNCRNRLFEKGVAFASAGYRHKAHGAHMPSPAADCADAVRYLALHAEEYRLDPDRVILAGHSAGAHLALLTALTEGAFTDDYSIPDVPCRVAGVVSASGPANLKFEDYPQKARRAILDCRAALLGEGDGDPDATAAAEPQHYIDTGAAPKIPVLCVHGESDTAVPIGMAEDLCRTGREKGYPFRLYRMPDTGHCFETAGTKDPSPLRPAAVDEVCRFVLDTLGIRD